MNFAVEKLHLLTRFWEMPAYSGTTLKKESPFHKVV